MINLVMKKTFVLGVLGVLVLAAMIPLLLKPSSAAAQTAITNEAAVSYYNNCRQNRDERMRAETQDAFCACTAGKMMESMSVEDVQIMAEQSQAGREKLNKMLIEVYAPCMNYPVSDLVEASCMENDKISQAGVGKTQEQICFCTADRTAAWFTREGRTLMKSLLLKTPNITDPITPVMESKAFKSQSYSNMISCLSGE